MDNNEVLRSLRKVLAANETTMAEILSIAKQSSDPLTMKNMLKHNNEADFHRCDDNTLAEFLEALIEYKRGSTAQPTQPVFAYRLTNNQILKKLRVAFELKDTDMFSLFAEGGQEIQKQELKSLFRNEEHKNFKPCDDKLLRVFLTGLAQRTRSAS